MRAKEFIEKIKHIETLPTTYYSVAGGDWGKWNGWSWNFDCVILIKATLWGWCENKNHPHGGAIYGSNGVYDDGTEQIINRCTEVSSDFSNITPGEMVWMPGHVGVYVGDRKVIECTAAWESKVVYSNLGWNGERTRNGYQVYSWQKHGKLPYIDYNEVEEKLSDNDIKYQVYTGYWLPNVKNMEDYAGNYGQPMSGIYINSSKNNDITYRVHTLGGEWLPEVVNRNDYAGNLGQVFDGIQIKSSIKDVYYKVRLLNGEWLSEVKNYDDYAGAYGTKIDAIYIRLEDIPPKSENKPISEPKDEPSPITPDEPETSPDVKENEPGEAIEVQEDINLFEVIGNVFKALFNFFKNLFHKQG